MLVRTKTILSMLARLTVASDTGVEWTPFIYGDKISRRLAEHFQCRNANDRQNMKENPKKYAV
jgi:hypothetical protein